MAGAAKAGTLEVVEGRWKAPDEILPGEEEAAGADGLSLLEREPGGQVVGLLIHVEDVGAQLPKEPAQGRVEVEMKLPVECSGATIRS